MWACAMQLWTCKRYNELCTIDTGSLLNDYKGFVIIVPVMPSEHRGLPKRFAAFIFSWFYNIPKTVNSNSIVLLQDMFCILWHHLPWGFQSKAYQEIWLGPLLRMCSIHCYFCFLICRSTLFSFDLFHRSSLEITSGQCILGMSSDYITKKKNKSILLW